MLANYKIILTKAIKQHILCNIPTNKYFQMKIEKTKGGKDQITYKDNKASSS